MNKRASKILALFLVIQTTMSVMAPVAYANDATMLEPLIEPNTKTYKVDVVSDKPSWFGSHYEGKYINFDAYYNTICKEGVDSGKLSIDKLGKDPTLCTRLNSATNGSTEFPAEGYDFFLKAEGYASGGTLITDDNKMETIMSSETDSFAGKKNDFVQGQDDGMKVLTFPSKHGGGAEDVTQAETDYAIKVGNTLSANLNTLLASVNGGKKFVSVSELINKSILIRPTSHGYTLLDTGKDAGYVIVYGTKDGWNNKYVFESAASPSAPTSGTFGKNTLSTAGYPNVDDDGNLLAYVIPTTQDSLSYGGVQIAKMDFDAIASFVWAMPKGYAKIDGIDSSLKFTNDSHTQYTYVTEGNDVPWITIHHLTMYANNAYKNFNISIDTKTSGTDSGNWFMTIIVQFFQELMHGLRTILGLSDMYTLVYNKGVRGSSTYNYGAMSDAWWTVVLRYHIIFQSLAWFLIICGFIKVLIDLNLSTVNPGKRMSVFQTVERFIVVGFLLVTIIPIVQFLLNMNSSIVNIFASQTDPNTTEAPVIASLAGLVLQFAYFGICVYINFTYIMRSIIIGILVVTAPFFIASMAFSQNNKQLFEMWSKELLANIFMQSVHAFSLAFLTNLVTTGGGLENLVVSYSIIPLTELVRNLIFQGAGSHASSLGMAAGSKFLNTAQSLGKGAANIAAGAALGKIAGGQEDGDKGAAGAGQGSGSGNKGGETGNVAALSGAISGKMSAIKGGIDAAGKAQGGLTGGQKAAKAALSVGQGAMSMASVVGGAMDMAMDMAGAEMTGRTDGYKSVGSKAAEVGASGIKAVGHTADAAGQTVGAAAHAPIAAFGRSEAGQNMAAKGAFQHMHAQQKIDSNPGKANVGAHLAQGVAAARMYAANAADAKGNAQGQGHLPTSVRTDARTGETVAGFKGGEGQSFTADPQTGGLTHRLNSSAISGMTNSANSGQSAGFYQDVQQIANREGNWEAVQDHYGSQGISIQADAQGGAAITYTRNYMHNAGVKSMSSSKDGKSAFVRTQGAPAASFAPTTARFTPPPTNFTPPKTEEQAPRPNNPANN